MTLHKKDSSVLTNRMKEAVKLQHINEYKKLSVYNLIVEIEGLQN